jgi:hypothetical protein
MDWIAMNSLKLYFPIALLILIASPVRADVMYQCIDESGHKSFSNIKPSDKGAKCTAMDLGPAEPASAQGAAKATAKTPTPATFPKVDDNAQKARDNDRRRILEGELSTEQASLEQAKRDLAQQEANPQPEERLKGGGINGAKVDERLQPFRDKVALHERNIEAIQKEIAKLR